MERHTIVVITDTPAHPQMTATGPPLANPTPYKVLGPTRTDKMLKERPKVPQKVTLRLSSWGGKKKQTKIRQAEGDGNSGGLEMEIGVGSGGEEVSVSACFDDCFLDRTSQISDYSRGAGGGECRIHRELLASG